MAVEIVINSWFGYGTDMLQVEIWSKQQTILSWNDFNNQIDST